MSKIKNILIVGLGKMGNSHLKSFSKSQNNYNIFIYDKNIVNLNKISEKNVYKLVKFPRNKIYDLAIIATNSSERYQILRKLIYLNKINFIILEKFLFNKIGQYITLDKIHKKNKLKINVNTWGSYLRNKLKYILNNKNLKKIQVFVSEGTILTSFIHYLDFYFTGKEKKIEIVMMLKKIVKSKRKGYSEALGKIIFKTKNKKIEIATKKNLENAKIIFTNNVTIIIDKNKKIIIYKKKKIIQKINFPYAHNWTEKNFYKNYINGTNKNFLNYRKISFLSRIFLEKLNEDKKTIKLNIT